MDKKEKKNNIFYALIIGAMLFVFWYMKKNKKEQEGGNADSSGSGSGSTGERPSLGTEKGLKIKSIGSVLISCIVKNDFTPTNFEKPKYLGVKHENLSDYNLKRTIQEYNKILKDEFLFDICKLDFYLGNSNKQKNIFGSNYRKNDFGLFHINFDEQRGLIFSVVAEIGEDGEGFYDEGMEIPFSNLFIFESGFNKEYFQIDFMNNDTSISKSIIFSFENSDIALKLKVLLLEIYASLGK